MPKLIKFICYIFILFPLYFISKFSLRTKKILLVGGQSGFRDNSKYFYLEAIKRFKNINIYWISKTKEEAIYLRKNKINAYYKWSAKGVLLSLRAYIYVYDSYVSSINIWTSGSSIKINLWHGIGIKNIERMITKGNVAKVFGDYTSLFDKFQYFQHYIKPTYFVTPSYLMGEHFKKCFDLKDCNLIYSGYPRCDIFNKENINNYLFDDEKSILIKINNKEYKKIYLYMPTWRDSGSDFLADAGFDLCILNEKMKNNNCLFVFKLHPNTSLTIKKTKVYENIIFLSSSIDIYPFLTSIDVLITDYSSIYFDFLLLEDKKIVLYPFDYDRFILNDRDLAFDYFEYMPGEVVYSFDELISALSVEQPEKIKLAVHKIKNQFWECNLNSNKLYEYIKKNLLD